MARPLVHADATDTATLCGMQLPSRGLDVRLFPELLPVYSVDPGRICPRCLSTLRRYARTSDLLRKVDALRALGASPG